MIPRISFKFTILILGSEIQQASFWTFGVTDLCGKQWIVSFPKTHSLLILYTALGPAGGSTAPVQAFCLALGSGSRDLGGSASQHLVRLRVRLAPGRAGGVSRTCRGRGQDGEGRAPRPSERPSLLHCSRRGAARLLTPNNGGSEPERRRRLRGWQRQRHPGPRRVPGVGPPGRQQHAG